MIQYISWKQEKETGNITREYLSMSDAVIPNILFKSFMSHSGFGGGGGNAGGGGGQGGSCWGGGGGGPPWWPGIGPCMWGGGGASSS